ncbi:hypothetical protein EZV62_018060 [Acer yangbiense]|uniref:Uncharacterized protein n=1 Tax=Acer yangbiense TaxID=1000413 RepID=A0A5C7HIC0_9ROSI|nr:hypothetical protein EZV62_018060 [Acer yangbiense]
MMNLLKIHHHPLFSHIPQITPPHQPNFPLKFSSLSSSSTLSLLKPSFKLSCLSKTPPLLFNNEQEKIPQFEDLAPDGVVYLKTLRLVECSMFAAVTGLVYFLSNSLSIENYFGCFFSLPIVISSMRWGVAAGRKTMVCNFLQQLFYNFRRGNSNAIACLVWSSEGLNLYSYTWYTWFHNGISVEVGSELGSFNILVHNRSRSWCNGLYFDILILNKRKYTCFGLAELWILCVPSPPIILGIPYQTWNEGFSEIAKMAGEGLIMTYEAVWEEKRRKHQNNGKPKRFRSVAPPRRLRRGVAPPYPPDQCGAVTTYTLSCKTCCIYDRQAFVICCLFSCQD